MHTPRLTVYEGTVHINRDDQTKEFVRFYGTDIYGILINEWQPRGLLLPTTFNLAIHQFDMPPPPVPPEHADVSFDDLYLPPPSGARIPIWLPNTAPRAAPSHAINSGPGAILFMNPDGSHHLRYE